MLQLSFCKTAEKEFIELALIRKWNIFYKCIIAKLPGEPLSFINVYILESGISKFFWCLGIWQRLQNYSPPFTDCSVE